MTQCKACMKFNRKARGTRFIYRRNRPKHTKLRYVDTWHYTSNISKDKTEVWECPLCKFTYHVNRDLWKVMASWKQKNRRPRRKRKSRPVPI